VAGQSPATADDEQQAALRRLAESRNRDEADRARAVLLMLAGSTSPQIAGAFGVREDTILLWRSDFARGGVAALRASLGQHVVFTPVRSPESNGVAEAFVKT
jgi:hypothetical protein